MSVVPNTDAALAEALAGVPRWGLGFFLAASIVILAKLVIGRQYGRARPAWYAWPGMDPERFHRPCERLPSVGERVATSLYMITGAAIVWGGVPRCTTPLAAGWVGAVGVALMLHFGIVRLFSIHWRSRGYDAAPLFDRPLAAPTIGAFWGRRWNRAIRDVLDRWIYRPLARRAGPRVASAAAFAASGVGHDALLSVPAGGGYGGGTLYFALQWCGLMLERRYRSRLLAIAVVALPLPLLLHAPFLTEVLLPFLAAIGAR